jgi:hypothetical protein
MLTLVFLYIHVHLNAFLQILEYFSQIRFGASSERISLNLITLNRELLETLHFLS